MQENLFKCPECKVEMDIEDMSALEEDWGICWDCIQLAKQREKEEAWIKYPCCGDTYGCRYCLGV